MSRFRKFFRTQTKDWTQESSIVYRRALKAAKFLGILPYNWNARREEVENSKSLTRFVIFITQYLVYLTYEGFVMYRYLYLTFDENASQKQKAAIEYVAFAYMIPVVLHSCSMFNRASLHNFINRLLSYVRHDFTRLPDDGGKLRKIGALVRVIPFVAVLVVCLNMVALFTRPASPHLLTSLVPDVEKRQKWVLIPFAVIHGYLWCNQWASILFYGTLMMSYISATLNALNRTRPNPQMSEERFYRATRKLETLQGNYNALFRYAWWAGEVILVTVFVLGFCGSIKNEGAQAMRQLFVSTLILAGLLTFWKGLGGVFETSSEVHWEWRRRDGLPSVLFRKRIKSMRPIRVEVGGYFYVDAGMTLTLLGIISDNTFNVLLAA